MGPTKGGRSGEELQEVMMAGLHGASDQDPKLSQRSFPAPQQITQIRACTNCVRAKAKCSPGNDIDERCDRYDVLTAKQAYTTHVNSLMIGPDVIA